MDNALYVYIFILFFFKLLADCWQFFTVPLTAWQTTASD